MTAFLSNVNGSALVVVAGLWCAMLAAAPAIRLRQDAPAALLFAIVAAVLTMCAAPALLVQETAAGAFEPTMRDTVMAALAAGTAMFLVTLPMVSLCLRGNDAVDRRTTKARPSRRDARMHGLTA